MKTLKNYWLCFLYLLILIPLAACDSSNSVGVDELDQLRNGSPQSSSPAARSETSRLVTELQALEREMNELEAAYQALGLSTAHLTDTLLLLDSIAQDFRVQILEIRESMADESFNATRAGELLLPIYESLESAMHFLTELEDSVFEATQENLRAQLEALPSSERGSHYQALYWTLHQLESKEAQFSGLRDLFNGLYNELVDDLNAKFGTELPQNPEEGQSPILQSSNSNAGGQVQGRVRDSLTGAGISGAFVGFKRRPESARYFYETQTNADGDYDSPLLRPNTYYVDIYSAGRVDVRAQAVVVEAGEVTEENVSLSQPLAEGQIRITVSWTSERPGAVKDVDSWLSIPGASGPLSYHRVRTDHYGTHLDRDDTNWEGPETTTIRNLRQGTYHFWVNNFSSPGDARALGNSDVRVRVYQGNELVRSYTVPQGSGINYSLFKIENGVIVDTGYFFNQSRPPR